MYDLVLKIKQIEYNIPKIRQAKIISVITDHNRD